MEFTVSPAVLVPRPDTETLVETALDWIQRRREIKNPGLLDLCTGSGAVAVSLKKESPGLKVLGSDISAEALKIAELNAAALLKPERGETPLTFIQSDLFQCIRGRFKLITVNPPYIPAGEIEKLSAEVRGEPRIALDGGEDGLALIRLIIEAAPDYLLPGGGLLMEIDPPQARTVPALLAKAGFQDIQIYRDLSGRDRVAGAVQPG
jgi:release factor glutamine methyltransferase